MRRNFRGSIFMPDDWESPKEEVRGPTRQLEGCLARPHPGRARHPPGCLVAPLGSPSRLYNPPRVETLKEELFPHFVAATVWKPREEKSHLRRADSSEEITSRKGRSSPSSSSSSRASSRSSSTSSPTSAPSPPPSNLTS